MEIDPRRWQVDSLGVPVGLESQENRILELEGSLEMTPLHRLGDTEKRACLGPGAVGRTALEPGRGCPAGGARTFALWCSGLSMGDSTALHLGHMVIFW